MQSIEVVIAPNAKRCRVSIDGHDISGVVQRIEIVTDVREHEPTRVVLHCVKLGEPFTIKGYFVEVVPTGAEGEVSSG